MLSNVLKFLRAGLINLSLRWEELCMGILGYGKFFLRFDDPRDMSV